MTDAVLKGPHPPWLRSIGRKVGTGMPLPLVMIMLAIGLALASGLPADAVLKGFNQGYGQSLGNFALILIPSFVLAACLARHPAGGIDRVAALVAPFAAAGMACPDTGYAALAPVAGRRKLSMALGGYAGFKLLVPAGPLIVATGLGIQDPRLFIVGLLLLPPVWVAGEAWVRARTSTVPPTMVPPTAAPSMAEPPTAGTEPEAGGSLRVLLMPFLAMAGLLVLGASTDLSAHATLDFLTRPKGALLVAAVWALAGVPASQRRECLDSAVRRTGSMLLLIGAASALGTVLIAGVPGRDLIAAQAGTHGVLVILFVAAMVFKVIQGSSMATFAALTPIVAPLVAASGTDPVGAVFALCLGSFVAILPNDSYYWLVRRDALAETGDGAAILTLAGGTVIQAGTGFLMLGLLMALGVVG